MGMNPPLDKETNQPTQETPGDPKLEWVEHSFTIGAKVGHFHLHICWEDASRGPGYGVKVSMSFSLVKLFSDIKEGKLAIENALREQCKAVLEQLGE